MWYLLILLIPPLLFAAWVGFDSHKRNEDTLINSLSAFVVAPIYVPIYYAKRNLKKDEIRKGGKKWNVLKSFAFVWAIYAINSFVFSEQFGINQADIGFFTLAMIWVFPVVGALALGFFFKKSSHVEKGPTGTLA